MTADAAAAPKKPAPLFVLFAGWLFPGGGHFLLGQEGRGIAFFFAVVATFAAGLAITGGAAVSPAEHPVALVAELPAGLAAAAPAVLELVRGAPTRLPEGVVANIDLGMLFCMMAGLWNVLLAHDAWERAVERRTR
jgi:hypothetical protein